MPLAKPLPALRQELREILTEDLAAALVALKEMLPETSDKHGQILALRARLNDANKERARNTLSPDDYQRRIDTIRAECFDLIGALEEADFEVTASAKSSAAKTAKHGSVLYRVPHRMPLRKPSICTIRVAIDEDAILEDIVFDDNVRLRQRVEVSDMMRAELLDPEGEVFSIRPLSEPEQLVREEGYTQWLFSVTPRVEGEHQLLVKVSMMEYNANLGKYVPREVSVLETITIVTETLAPADDAPLKATGESFALGPDLTMESFHSVEVPSSVLPQPAPAARPIRTPESPIPRQPIPSGLRAVAFLLIFLLAGGSATWAFTPPPTRDWWLASLKDDTEAYTNYIEKYKDSDSKQHLEKAYFYKADKTGALRDLRDYQRQYPEGQFRERVLEKVKTLEIKSVESIRQQPEAEKIRQFVQDFPESERLSELKQAVAARAELLPVVEEAYVYSIDAQPTRTKVLAYLLDFPQRERLPEVAEAAASRPEVLREVQPDLENAYLQKMEQNPTVPQAEAFLQQFPVPTQREKFERILEKKPALKKQFLQKMEKAAEEQQAREEAERIRAAEEAAEKARLEELKRRAQETKDAAERERLEKEAAEEVERQRLKKEAEEVEARRDTDGDGIPDKDDNCPKLKNPNQTDSDKDNVGDECDNCPFVATRTHLDLDGDGIGDLCDDCPSEKGIKMTKGCPEWRDGKLTYFRKHKDSAIKAMKKHKVPASILLAQAVLASAATAAEYNEYVKYANNHFGIRCGSDWKGEKYKSPSDDRDSDGKIIPSCIRKYNSAEESYEDQAKYLASPENKSKYGSLFNLDIQDYKGWANGILATGYSTDQTYAQRLISLIEQYELYKYDR
ncbi:MAG TPA: glucosaminidase domain-containing protein [Saprospiraceae bacterium]|nr:glucosaminidase domain-containing protein [Saprospiraceae bacterium]